ncbi:hypothetical protein [Desmospora profundinema]|uniref:Uncharacterized protein n=1 Tax=Desmospora profundinema TaxID=1571184 RepID=A0ABU1II14_9BACL|nr:hypothetical protein [Desmospora profundinema]MDR6224411.1 hypothetical protein [Desmospora profundinema]
MKTVNVPPFFHEVWGKRTTKLELGITIIFSVTMTVVLFAFTYSEWRELELWKIVILASLALDITGGVIANLTFGTNHYYKHRPTARYIFLFIHVQPVIFALILWNYFAACIAVWGYTILSALFVNRFINHPAQRVIAAVFLTSGIGGLFLLFYPIPKFLFILLLFYVVKVIYSFAVDHYAEREG